MKNKLNYFSSQKLQTYCGIKSKCVNAKTGDRYVLIQNAFRSTWQEFNFNSDFKCYLLTCVYLSQLSQTSLIDFTFNNDTHAKQIEFNTDVRFEFHTHISMYRITVIYSDF